MSNGWCAEPARARARERCHHPSPRRAQRFAQRAHPPRATAGCAFQLRHENFSACEETLRRIKEMKQAKARKADSDDDEDIAM